MTELLTSPFAFALTLVLLHFLWQGALVAIGYWLVAAVFPIRTAQGRYTAALSALLLMVACPVATLFLCFHSRSDSEAGTTVISTLFPRVHNVDSGAKDYSAEPLAGSDPVLDSQTEAAAGRKIIAPQSKWNWAFAGLAAASPFAVAAWLAGVVFYSLRLMLGAGNLVFLNTSRQTISADLMRRSQTLATRLGLPSARIFSSQRIQEAAVVGFWRPMVLVPCSWIASLPSDVLDAVIAHELAHIRRHDVWINLFQRVAESLLFYHPAIWWLSNRVRLEREMCCDELAVQATGERGSYAIALEQVGRLHLANSMRPALPFRGTQEMKLLCRIQNVLGAVITSKREPAWLIGVAILSIPLLLLGAGDSLLRMNTAFAHGLRQSNGNSAEQSATLIPEDEAGDDEKANTDKKKQANETKPKPTTSKVSDEKPALKKDDKKQRSDDAPAEAESAATEKNSLLIKGRVLDFDGKPFRDAEIWFPAMTLNRGLQYTDQARSDSEGRFQIRANRSSFPAGVTGLPITIYGSERGMAWGKVELNKAQEQTFQLTKDNAIRGRVLNSEGLPAPGVLVRVTGILQAKDGSLDSFLRAWKSDFNIALRNAERLNTPLTAKLAVRTNEKGEFQLTGIGAERVAFLELKHSAIATASMWVVNREGFEPQSYNAAALQRLPPASRQLGLIPRLYAPEFSQVVEPGRSIEGIVRGGPEKKPIAGATVSTMISNGSFANAITDEQGKFELKGVGTKPEHTVHIAPNAAQTAYLTRSVRGKFAAGSQKLSLDVQLVEGVAVTGRVVDATTGEGVFSSVQVVPLPGNKFYQQPGIDTRTPPRVTTKFDGTFRVIAIPGPSVLTVQVLKKEKMGGNLVNPYCEASFSDEDAKRVDIKTQMSARYFVRAGGQPEFLLLKSAVKYADLKADKETHFELPVERGKTLSVNIRDEKGEPIRGVYAKGVTDHYSSTLRLTDSQCTLLGMSPDRPRQLLLVSPQRKLSAVLNIDGSEKGPLNVQMQATGAVQGRALDEGVPIENALVHVRYISPGARELQGLAATATPQVRTNSEGRFHLEGILPNETFVLDFQDGDRLFRGYARFEQRTVKSGQLRDYGDLTIQKIR